MAEKQINHDLDGVLGTLHNVLERENSLSRCCAVSALEKLNACDDESKNKLIGLLLDEDPDVRMDAASALGHLKIEEAIEPLLYNLKNDPEGEVRIEVVKALAKIKSQQAVEPLIHCLMEDGYPELDNLIDDMESSPCWEVQSQSLDALGEIGDQRAVEAVMQLLEKEDYEELQEIGFRVLARLNTDTARTFLLKQLQHGSRLAKRRAARALIYLPEFNTDDQVLPADLLNGLTNALVDSDPAVRIYAAQALGSNSNPLVAIPLTMLLNDPDVEVVKEVIAILGKFRGPEIIDRLHALLDAPDPELLCQVIRVLGDIGDPVSLEFLNQQLETKNTGVLYEVVCALGKLGMAGPEEKLAAILENKNANSDLRIQTAMALGNVFKGNAHQADDEQTEDKPTPAKILTQSIFDDDERVCLAALTALEEMNPETIEETLLDLLQNKSTVEDSVSDDDEHQDTISGKDAGLQTTSDLTDMLQELPGKGNPENSTLASILARQTENEEAPIKEATVDAPFQVPIEKKSPAHSIQLLAIRLLGNISDPSPLTVSTLITKANSSNDNDLRQEALRALGRIGDRSTLPVIIKGLEAQHQEIRLAALEALEHFTGEPGVEDQLTRLFANPDPYTRLQVIKQLGSTRGEKTVECLSQALEDDDMNVCRAALSALSEETYNQNYSTPIVDLMFKFSGELRKEAATALRRVNDFESTSRLLETLNNQEHEEWHWVCIDALAEMHADENRMAN